MMMRSLLVVAVLGCCLALASASTALDADDQALMELGIDLSNRVEPTPTYTTTRPPGHEDPLIAKFPMLHEIEGIEKQDWNDIQGLLFREPPSAAESNVDMKLDELEQKFNQIDTMPVPSSVAPKGSTLLPSLKKPEVGLFATLPKSLAPRLQQVKKMAAAAAAPAPKAAAPAAAAHATAAPAAAAHPAAAPAKAATPAPAAAKPAAAKPAVAPAAAKPAAPAAAKPAAAAKKAAPAKPLTVDEIKLKEDEKKKGEERVRNTVATVRLIEKRMKGLNSLIQRLKSQIGLKTEEAQSSTQRLTAALQKHRKDKADLAKRMAARKSSFMEVDAAHETEAETEGESEAEVEHEVEAEAEAETETDAESDIAAVINTEVEGEHVQEADADAQLDADAEAVDSIIDSLL